MIKTIQKADLLTNEAIEKLSDLSQELEKTFNNVQVHRTRTEMEVSVLNNIQHPTPASKYWQAMREQNIMLQGIVLLSFDYRTEKTKAKILINKIEDESDPLEKELLQIELERKFFLLKNIERTAKAKMREIQDWSEIKNRESKNMSEEDLADAGNHQLISYTRRWINQAIEMGDNGSPSERQNLMGQLQSGINLCIKKGVLHKALEGYGNNIREQVLLKYGN